MTYDNLYTIFDTFFFGLEMPSHLSLCVSEIFTCLVLFLIYALPLIFTYFCFKFILRCFLWDL